MGVVAEHGAAGASVELVIARAGVSHRAFYSRFADVEECLKAVLDGVLAQLAARVARAFAREGRWLDGMRAALAAMLEFFDSEPALARVFLVETMAGGAVVREHRERVVEALRLMCVEGIEVQVATDASPLVREGVRAAVTGIINTRLMVSDRAPLLELLGPLMGIIVEPFLPETQVAREIERGNELARELLAGARAENPRALAGAPGGSSIAAARAGVVRRLRARQGELVQEIFVRVRAGALAGAGDDDAGYVAGLRATVVAAVDHVLEQIERGGDWAGAVPAVACEQARRAARAGVSLDTVLRRYLVGHTLFEQFIMDEADRSGLADEREVLRAALRVQAALLDGMLERVTVEYGDELARIGRSPEQRRSEHVRRLLEGGTVELAGFDYELEDRWHLGVIAVGAAAAQAVQGLAVSTGRRLLRVAQGGESVWAWLGGRERVAEVEIERASADVVAGDGTVVAVGEWAWGVEGWRLTHRQARAALVVALRRRGSGAGALTRYADVALLASALNDELLGRALIDVYVAPLEDSRYSGAVLRETLRAYLAAGRSVSSAAAALGVTRSTVESRLRAAEQSLGRLLPACQAELEVALHLEELGESAGVKS
ncbi:MAG TPA: helix-turn-helix domain-containing protein [Solirubrobacteraceae bacterium]|nr:helix-turn-helix domain-containing protein [Solirubrobacteraceae bacterium]